MPAQNPTTEQLLEAYYKTSTKYFVVPVPARVERSAAVRFVRDHVSTKETKQKLGKLSRLAIFHDLSETAEAFAAILDRHEKAAEDFARSAIAVSTIAWVGEEPQVATAQKYFQVLLERADAMRDRALMLEAADAIGPREGTDNITKWMEKEIAKREQAADAAKPEAQGRLADLREFLKFRVSQVRRANDVRQSITGAKDDAARIRKLAPLYLRDTTDDAPTLEYWSAITLVHMGRENLPSGSLIGDEFIRLAGLSARKDPKLQPELDWKRARALRAADYFGQRLAEADNTWLNEQADDGSDIIALRPNWTYAGSGNEADQPPSP